MSDAIETPPAPARPWYQRRTPLERVAMGLMALGALMMFQPFVLWLYTYSFIVFLLATVMFTVVSHFED
ncbi:MAG: hypothetical protein H7Z42_20915 [Roseiflexaceae bacterium]|nr:hypothetical protein [Roseiflexaceae bacterium]